jgi:hypothetical protein
MTHKIDPAVASATAEFHAADSIWQAELEAAFGGPRGAVEARYAGRPRGTRLPTPRRLRRAHGGARALHARLAGDEQMSTVTARVRELNDAFRRSFSGGRVVMTAGVNALPPDVLAEALRKVRVFDEFTKDNDPHGEHDFGAFEVSGESFFWKIDCYDRAMEFGSEDPSDPAQTTRVLTIMLADEY